jgi:hypothetical protein
VDAEGADGWGCVLERSMLGCWELEMVCLLGIILLRLLGEVEL